MCLETLFRNRSPWIHHGFEMTLYYKSPYDYLIDENSKVQTSVLMQYHFEKKMKRNKNIVFVWLLYAEKYTHRINQNST